MVHAQTHVQHRAPLAPYQTTKGTTLHLSSAYLVLIRSHSARLVCFSISICVTCDICYTIKISKLHTDDSFGHFKVFYGLPAIPENVKTHVK